MSAYGSITQEVRRMLARPDGLSRLELSQELSLSRQEACTVLYRKRKKGQCFGVPADAPHAMRYFDSQARAEAWVKANPVRIPGSKRITSVSTRALALLGSNPVTSMDVAKTTGVSQKIAQEALSKWVAAGKCFRARVAEPRARHYCFFADAASRDAWDQRLREEAEKRRPARKPACLKSQEASRLRVEQETLAAARSMPQGFWIKQLADALRVSIRAAESRIAKLMKRGLLFRGEAYRAPYFADAAAAKQWGKKSEPVKRKFAAIPAKPAMEQPVRIKNHGRPTLGGEIIVPAHVKRVECPNYTHNHRYQVAPGEVPFGAGFASIGIGRSVETGRGWD